MSKWKEFREFVDKVVNTCARKTGFKLVFRSEPWDRTGDLIKGGKYYAHANFKGRPEMIDEFMICVEDLAKSERVDVLVKKSKVVLEGGNRIVGVYYPLGEEEAEILMKGTVVLG